METSSTVNATDLENSQTWELTRCTLRVPGRKICQSLDERATILTPLGCTLAMINSKFEGVIASSTEQRWRYRGAMSNNMAHGIGVLYSVDGSKLYEGDFKDGQKHGSGHECT